MKSSYFLITTVFLTVSFRASGQAPVPPEYEDLYTTMQGSIASFNSLTLATWNGSKPPVTFAAHLLSTNSNQGSDVLTSSNYTSFLHEMDGLKALGAKGVVVNIDYPILDPAFDGYGGQSAAYLAFYQSVANDVHARGLKMIVETGGIFSDAAFSRLNVAPFYRTLTYSAYVAGRARQAALIATAIRPDYLNVVSEPDTESDQTGFSEIYTLSGSLTLLNGIVDAVRGAGSSVPLGAGVGTWLSMDSTGKSYTDYVSAYAAIAGLDNVDVHVYPVIRDFLTRLNTIAGLARTAGKGLTMSEAWAYKVRDSELSNTLLYTPAVLYARDAFSFWAPLDTQFLQALTNWSYSQNLTYMAVFWSDYFRAYVDYDSSTQNLAPSQLLTMVESAAGAAIMVPAVTSTGSAWYTFVVNPSDDTPPEAPVVTSALYPQQVVLTWPPVADNIGVYKYMVARQGAPAVTTVDPIFTEANLTSCGKYVYNVTAFDLKNNYTATTTSVLTTPDNTAPTAPTALSATPGAVVPGSPTTTSIRLGWSGATDNCGPSGIASYDLYRSLGSADGPWTYWKSLPGSPQSYTDSGIQRSATMICYKLRTADSVGLRSGDSPVACTMTKDFQPPSVPAGLAATMGTAPNVNLTWNASKDDVSVAGYELQRRQGTSGSFSVIPTVITGTKFTDTTAAPLPDTVAPTVSIVSPAAGSALSRTITFQASATDKGVYTVYTYQARSVDTSGNRSVFGTGATITWPTVGGKVASVAFFVDGQQVSLVTAAPFYIRWDSKSVANGVHTFQVKATDAAGNSTTSAAVTATVAN